LEIGEGLTQAMVTCPSYLPWRSQAALAHLALGDHESAGRLAEEELELARAFGAPRALGVAMRAAGVVAGGERGELLLREAIDAFERGDASLERARALADLGAMLRRRNRRTEARQLLREALDTAHRAGARPLAQQAETELPATRAAARCPAGPPNAPPLQSSFTRRPTPPTAPAQDRSPNRPRPSSAPPAPARAESCSRASTR